MQQIEEQEVHNFFGEQIESDLNEDVSDFNNFVEEVENPNGEKKFPNKFAKLLHQRNEAKKKAQELEQKLQIFDEVDLSEIDEYKNKKLLESKFSDAQQYYSRIKELLNSNSGMSWENAYKIIKFEYLSDIGNQNKFNSKKTEIVGFTPNKIKAFKRFDSLNPVQQLDYLKRQFKDGKINI